MSRSIAEQKAIFTELVKVGIAWHDAYKAVQAEDDPVKKEKFIYDWEVLERKLQRLMAEREKLSVNKSSAS